MRALNFKSNKLYTAHITGGPSVIIPLIFIPVTKEEGDEDILVT